MEKILHCVFEEALGIAPPMLSLDGEARLAAGGEAEGPIFGNSTTVLTGDDRVLPPVVPAGTPPTRCKNK